MNNSILKTKKIEVRRRNRQWAPEPLTVRYAICHDCFFNDTATTEIYTLSLHDALPIFRSSTVQSRATAGVAGGTYLFALPGSPSACRDAWEGILVHQLDNRFRPCNFVELMPRLQEHLKR